MVLGRIPKGQTIMEQGGSNPYQPNFLIFNHLTNISEINKNARINHEMTPKSYIPLKDRHVTQVPKFDDTHTYNHGLKKKKNHKTVFKNNKL